MMVVVVVVGGLPIRVRLVALGGGRIMLMFHVYQELRGVEGGFMRVEKVLA